MELFELDCALQFSFKMMQKCVDFKKKGMCVLCYINLHFISVVM